MPDRPKPRRSTADPALDRSLTYRLHQLHKLTDRGTQRAYLAELDLPIGEARSLAAIGAFQPVSVNALARHTSLDKAQASRAARALIERGWVERHPNRLDGRGIELSLSAEGLRSWRRVMKVIVRRNAEIFGVLDDAEQQVFSDLLDRLIAAAGPIGDPDQEL